MTENNSFWNWENVIISRINKIHLEIITVSILLIIHCLLAVSASSDKSPVFDESVHIAGGLSYWQQNDYRINPENGNLPQRWAAIPLLFKNLSIPDLSKTPLASTDSWTVGRNLLFSSPTSPDSILSLSRFFITLLSMATGIAVYIWSRKAFGIPGGLISLFLYALCPEILAHAGFVTSDMAVALAFLLSITSIWYVLEKITLSRVLFSSLSLSLLFISKFSAIIIIPVYLALILVRLALRTPLECRIFRWKRNFQLQFQQLTAILSICTINAIFIYCAIWASYGFRFSMTPGDQKFDRQVLDGNFRFICKSAPETKILLVLREHEILPEAYLFGFAFVVKYSKARYSFLCGELSRKGRWYFFPYSFAIKTPFPLLLVFAFSFLILTGYFPGINRAVPREGVLLAVPLAIFIVIYLIFAMASNLNIGIRHLLPIYPALFIISGATACLFKYGASILKSLLFFLLLWFAAESFMIRPDYLAYFNQLAGGPESGYHHLVDSSLDWGQDLKTLSRWLDSHRKSDEEVYISYFGTADLKYYLRNYKKLPCYFEQDSGSFEPFCLKGGIYCISATMFQFTYFETALMERTGFRSSEINEELFRSLSAEIGEYARKGIKPEEIRDNPAELVRYGKFRKKYELYNYLRFAKICIHLNKRKPDAYAGYSILIFKLTDKDIEEAISN